MRIEIITTRHWKGDARLNRHAEYLAAAGHVVTIESFHDRGRVGSIAAATRSVFGSRADVVVLPDPEFFAVGSISAGLSGKRSVIDIHEDYASATRNRAWIPQLLKPVVTLLAGVMVALGRLLAWQVMVAAPQLARPGDHIVLNVADPSTLSRVSSHKDPGLLVYVGDITIARGAIEMVQSLAALPERHHLLLIGPISDTTRTQVLDEADDLGVLHRLELTGRLDHEEAWRVASGAQFGLSLLQDTPAYRDAVATKLWEYIACGLIPVVSDLPGQAAFVSKLDPRLVCPGPRDVAEVISSLARDEDKTRDLSLRAREMARNEWDEARPDKRIQAVFSPVR